MSDPDTDKLVICVESMAIAMELNPLPKDSAMKLLSHVLFEDVLNGVEGKNSWQGLAEGLITEREVRNLLMSNCATYISQFNSVIEKDCIEYTGKKLCMDFEFALYGREAKLLDIDHRDPWEAVS